MYLYEDAIKFLSSFGPVSSENRKFLQAVYANAVFAGLRTVSLPADSPSVQEVLSSEHLCYPGAAHVEVKNYPKIAGHFPLRQLFRIVEAKPA